MQNGKASPHFGQVEGILNSGVRSFFALAEIERFLRSLL
jgi:hypothetical protein